jgi:hypothetical protein
MLPAYSRADRPDEQQSLRQQLGGKEFLMSYRWIASIVLLTAMSLSGCVGIHYVGTGYTDSCDQCDGGPSHPIPYGPLEALSQAHRSLVCSGGCGEVYYGEWISTPPDCVDPCCGDEFVGGCRDKCLPCVRLHGFLGCLVGRRFRCDDTPGLFDVCRLCGHDCCEGCCDECASCCGDEIEMDGESVIYEGAEISRGEIISERPGPTTSRFKPMPGSRMSAIPVSAHKPGCNCGQH